MPIEIKKDDLLARLAAHDTAAMASLFDQLAPSLRGMIQRIIPSPDEAENVLEGLFLRLWKRAEREGLAGASLEAWLFVTARGDAAQRRRKGLRMPSLGIPAGEDLVPPWLPQSREINLLSSRLDLVSRSLAQLPKAQRQILDLVLYEGLTEVEVAAALKEPPGKVRDHVRAALSFVRQRLHTLMGTWTADI
ncbi:MAG: RNA polymerase sigma factor [Terriglobia bacterium]